MKSFSYFYTEYPSYTQMRKQREEYRLHLVQLIMPPEDDEDTKEAVFPNAEERKMLRYYHYIKHGIDTAHVAPLASKVLKKFASKK